MQYGEDYESVFSDGIEDAVRKSMNESAANGLIYARESCRVEAHSVESFIEFTLELDVKVLRLISVPFLDRPHVIKGRRA